MDGNMQVSIDSSGSVPIVTASGEIDIATAPLLAERLGELPSDASSVVVDLSEVTFLDSTALGVLIACEKRIQDGAAAGKVRLVIARPEILKIFDITGLRDLFPIMATLEDALAAG